MANIGPGGAARNVLDASDGAVGQHGFQPDNHIFNRPVERGKLADAAGCHQAAHLRQRLRLRRVPGGVAFCPQRIFENFQRHAALRGCLHIFNINIQDLVHPGTVQHHRIFHDGFEATFGRRGAGTRYAVDLMLVHKGQYVRNLFCRA